MRTSSSATARVRAAPPGRMGSQTQAGRNVRRRLPWPRSQQCERRARMAGQMERGRRSYQESGCRLHLRTRTPFEIDPSPVPIYCTPAGVQVCKHNLSSGRDVQQCNAVMMLQYLQQAQSLTFDCEMQALADVTVVTGQSLPQSQESPTPLVRASVAAASAMTRLYIATRGVVILSYKPPCGHRRSAAHDSRNRWPWTYHWGQGGQSSVSQGALAGRHYIRVFTPLGGLFPWRCLCSYTEGQ